MTDFLGIMGLPLLACFVFAGIHSYLGYHVIKRQVIFVDLALAQIAVLGASSSLLFGYEFESVQSYWMALSFTVAGSAVFALTRNRIQKIPQEAIIGIVYAVSAAMLILILSRTGEGDERIRQMLAGNILLVRPHDVIKTAAVYLIVGIFHWIYRKKFFLISDSHQDAYRTGLPVRFWDFLFYVSFGIVITSSVKVAGVLLVFAFLIVPPVCAIMLADSLRLRLMFGWLAGFAASILGMLISYFWDLPTAASVVAVFGAMLSLISLLTSFKKSS